MKTNQMKTVHFKTIGSTNEYCKTYTNTEDLTVIADRQSAGCGTKGREFVSSVGGVYISVMRSYADFDARDAFKIMVSAAVAVCETLEFYDVTPIIRWPNDVLVNGRKISGTLIENFFLGDKIVKSIIGIGINVNNELPNNLIDTGISLRQILNKKVGRRRFIKKLIKNLAAEHTISEYREHIDWFGKSVRVTLGEVTFDAVAMDVTDDGRLTVSRDGKIEMLSSAEVSLRL